MVHTDHLPDSTVNDNIINNPSCHGEMETRRQTIKTKEQTVVTSEPYGASTGYLYCMHILRV